MITIINQDQNATYNIEYFHLKWNEEFDCYDMIGRARFDLEETALVILGHYKFYKQAIEVFAQIDYNDNDLMYYRTNKKVFQMPENITDPQTCIMVYGSLY